MKFVVTRSGQWFDDDPKCPNVQKEMVSKNGKLSEAYTISIDSIDDLHKLSKKVEHPLIVFPKSNYGFEYPELEIYDGCRE